MQYPLMSEYVSAIRDASDNLDELAHLVPVLDDHGEPYRSSGAFAVVFKMKDEQTGKCYALKCFLEEQEGRAEAYRLIADELDCIDSSYVTSVKYLEKEIFVDSSCEEDEFPVLLMDWVEGETMETYIANNYQDEYAMGMLCYRFCKMAAWLRSQPFAHGDIKPDNIIVRPDGTLTLVDYDGMFVPAMNGQKSPTIGTKDFSHPLRTVDDFDETIDDFALASIALSLKAISLKPSLLDEYGAADRLLFSADDYRDLSKSKVMTALQEVMNDEEFTTLLSMFLLVSSKKNLAMCSFRLFVGKKPELKMEFLSTEVTDKDLEEAVTDGFGVKYSRDGKRLLQASVDLIGSYEIKANTKVICNLAFCCTSLSSVVIPDGVIAIGEDAFSYSKSLSSIVIPNSVSTIGSSAFCGTSLSSIVIPDGVTTLEDDVFNSCSSLSSVVIPNSVMSIGNRTFANCHSLSSIIIPNSVTIIKGNPFVGWGGILRNCSSMFLLDKGVLFDKEKKTIIAFRRNDTAYAIPESVITIGEDAFSSCSFLSSIAIPSSVTTIGDGAFSFCSSLSSITLPNSVTTIGDGAFSFCSSLSSITLPESVTTIGDNAFNSCSSLSSIAIPSSVTTIGKSVFWKCESLSSIAIPSSVTTIGESAFWMCKSLSNISLPNSVTSIGESAFSYCRLLSSIVIPDRVTSIENRIFSHCYSLSSVGFPDSIITIGEDAFLECESLSSIVIPNSVTSIGDGAFGWCKNLSCITLSNSMSSIGDYVFCKCKSMSHIDILDNVSTVGKGTFYECDSLPSSIKEKLIARFGKEVFEDVSY